MKINRIIKYYLFGESLKEIEMNRILDKISKKSKLTNREKSFLELYNSTQFKDDDRDWMMLSKTTVSHKIKELIKCGKVVICDLHDKNGKFGLQIIEVDDNIEEDYSLIKMKGEENHKLLDKFLYNLIYNTKKDQYSLQEQDEYFEKITHEGEN